MYTFVADLDVTEQEFEEVSYGYAIKDADGEVMAMTYDEETATLIVNALNAQNKE